MLYIYLGFNESLIDVLLIDNEYVLSRGYTHQQLAQWLRTIINLAYEKGTGSLDGIKADFEYEKRHYKVTTQFFLGSVTSPFPSVKGAATDWFITDVDTGLTLRISAMLPDMIEKFGFYEGSVPYRVPPEAIIALMEGKEYVSVKADIDEFIEKLLHLFYFEKQGGSVGPIVLFPNPLGMARSPASINGVVGSICSIRRIDFDHRTRQIEENKYIFFPLEKVYLMEEIIDGEGKLIGWKYGELKFIIRVIERNDHYVRCEILDLEISSRQFFIPLKESPWTPLFPENSPYCRRKRGDDE